MKHWPAQVFPIILLALLVGLTFWLRASTEVVDIRPDGKNRHDPDAYGENLIMRRFDDSGLVKYRLTAPRLVHFADDDSTELEKPVLVSYRPGAPSISVSSRFAKVSSHGEIVYLWDDVRVARAATDERPELVAKTPDLTARPDDGFAFTASPVEITQGASWITGIGAEIDQNRSTFVLQSHVKGHYIRPRGTP